MPPIFLILGQLLKNAGEKSADRKRAKGIFRKAFISDEDWGFLCTSPWIDDILAKEPRFFRYLKDQYMAHGLSEEDALIVTAQQIIYPPDRI